MLKKAKSLNKFKPPDLELNFNKGELTPLIQSESKEDVVQLDDTGIIEQPNGTTVTVVEESDQKLVESHCKTARTPIKIESTKRKLSLHDQLAISLERQMQIIEAQEEAAKAKMSEQTTPLEIYTSMGAIVYDGNATHPLEKQISEFAHRYKDATKVLSLSQELAAHERIAQDIQNIVDQRPTEVIADMIIKNITINTDNIKYAWERDANEEQSTRSLAEQMEFIHQCMDQQKHLHDGDFTTIPNDQPNRIEKRSIPKTNPEILEDKQRITTETPSGNYKQSEQQNDDIKSLKNAFPGVNNFWDVFVTSPVEVILNNTRLYNDELSKTNMQDYEKEYYDKLVKSLKEKGKQQTHEPQFASDSSNTDEHIESKTVQTKFHTKVNTEKYDVSEELEELMGQFENPTSVEKNVAKKLLEKMKMKTTRHPKDRLGPDQYAQYMDLKKSLDEQYKDIQTHLNQTHKDIQKLFFDMRNLKEEKANHDYFEKYENHFSHLSTPVNYSETTIYINGPSIPMENPVSSINSSEVWPGELLTAHGKQTEDSNILKHEELDDDKSLIIRTEPQEEFNSRLHKIYYETVQSNPIESTCFTENTKNIKKIDYESLERYDRKRYRENVKMELKADDTIIPHINDEQLEFVHENLMKRLNKTKSSFTRIPTTKGTTETHKPWFEESVFDKNDPKILYAKYLHNVRNMSVKLNMEVGKKNIKNITYFNREDRMYAHQYKTTTECRRFSHIIPFWLTQPKEIEDVFKGNTKIFREYIQYILDKHNFTELPAHGRFAFIRRYINKLNNPLIFNRITIFPTAYITTDHVLSLKEQILHFKGHMKSKIHKAYKHVKHFLFNSSIDDLHDPATIANTEPIPEEVIINITTPPSMGPYYDYY